MSGNKPIRHSATCEFDAGQGNVPSRNRLYASWPAARRSAASKAGPEVQRRYLFEAIILLVLGACSAVALIEGLQQVVPF